MLGGPVSIASCPICRAPRYVTSGARTSDPFDRVLS